MRDALIVDVHFPDKTAAQVEQLREKVRKVFGESANLLYHRGDEAILRMEGLSLEQGIEWVSMDIHCVYREMERRNGLLLWLKFDRIFSPVGAYSAYVSYVIADDEMNWDTNERVDDGEWVATFARRIGMRSPLFDMDYRHLLDGDL